MAALNYKNMVKQYYRFEADHDIWNAFSEMRIMGFIDEKTWNRFYNTCNSWYFNKEDRIVRDCYTGEIICIK